MSPLLHLPTLLILSVLLAVMLGAVLLWLWWVDRSQVALRSWGIAHLLVGIGFALAALRGVAANWVSIDVANALIALCYGLTWHGARQFEGRRGTPPAAIVIGAAIWLAACRMPGFYDRLDLRVALISVIVAAYCAAATVEFLRGRWKAPLPSHLAVAAMMGTHAALHLLRIPLALLLPMATGGTAMPVAPWFVLALTQGVLHGAGTAVLVVALAKERHEQRATAVLAEARDTAAAASAEKSRFLARISHELRTPLNGVLGLAQALAHDTGLNSRQRDQAATMEQAGRHLVAVVSDMLDLARVEAEQLELSPQPLLLRPLLEEALEQARAAAGPKPLMLRLHMAPDLPPAMRADPARLRQILNNLLGRAVAATPHRGRVALLATRLGPHGGLRLAVTDTGPVVPPERRARLFQEHLQDLHPGSGSGGTGLGLAVAAAMAGAMGGSIRHAEGPGGVGSTFTVELPLPVASTSEAPAAAPPATAPGSGSIGGKAPPRARPLRVMVVDDVAANRMVAAALLTQAGHSVIEAADGLAALEMLEQVGEGGAQRPDAVLMDLSMPGMDGFTAATRIRALPGPVARVPIIALTADAMPEQQQACREAGMDAVLAKPVEREALLTMLARFVAA
jgi:signal transduction histidine kinase